MEAVKHTQWYDIERLLTRKSDFAPPEFEPSSEVSFSSIGI